ncbi:TPA: glycosyltransferase family 2 protein [Bacillus cereus]|nr:glycosyltransferase family 2 protein [Bacillus cereus]
MRSTYPLISILIPTYNRVNFFEIALQSALKQKYPNIEIIIGDDSTNKETEILIKEKYLGNHPNIKYIKNGTQLGQFQNNLMLFEHANGQFINFLMDDDVYHPEKLNKMITVFESHPNLTLVTSYRKLINSEGVQINDQLFNTRLYEKNTILRGKDMGNKMLLDCCNWIGEPTTPLFKKKDLTEPFGTLNRRPYNCCIDMASWIHLLSKGDIAYIPEALSYFRIHPNQQQQSFIKQAEGLEDLMYLVFDSENYDFLTSKVDKKKALQTLFEHCFNYLLYHKKNYTIKQKLFFCLRTIQTNLELL